MCVAAPRGVDALELMLRFAERTGLTSKAPSKRYLWTDAFAVCNFLALDRYDLAAKLVDRVHAELGVARGIRIGKPLRERGADEPYDPDLEWERDGQYFHYLTKWMHALHQIGDDSRARRLMNDAHEGFTYGPPGRRRMFWKMSIDLRRPLVTSMGQHDPLDGYVTCEELGDLAHARDDFAEMLSHERLTTTDPLGLGGLLFDAARLRKIGGHDDLARTLVAAAREGLRRWVAGPDLDAPAEHRLAFRELGLAIGLAAVPNLADDVRDAIEAFWLRPESRRASTWTEHRDIDEVMLATTLLPDGFVVLAPVTHGAGSSMAQASV